MKKQLKAFLLGAAVAMILSGLIVSSLAISGQMTITVDPINILVNGHVFQPKDSTGREVPIFQYNGTTYAPLRALAESYGLEVGYNSELNLATVSNPSVKQPSNAIPKYANYPDVPDFGAIFNIYPLETSIKEDGTIWYYYSDFHVDAKYMAQYTGTLESNGFECLDLIEDQDIFLYSFFNGVHLVCFGLVGSYIAVAISSV